MSLSSRTPSLTPSRSPSPSPPPVQPDHFYGSDNIPSSPDSNGKTWLDPEDDPLAHRGIPVFRPTMDEFEDFEAYITKIECWGTRSGIVKVIPPKEWTDALPPLKNQLSAIKIKSPIEQHMLGRGGLFRQENIEKRRILSVREWVELCRKDEFKAPGVEDVGHHTRNAAPKFKPTKRTKKMPIEKVETADLEQEDDGLPIKPEVENENPSGGFKVLNPLLASPDTPATPATPINVDGDLDIETTLPADGEANTTEIGTTQSKPEGSETTAKTKTAAQIRETKEANLAARAARDAAFLETFDPHTHWLPPNTTPSDYTSEFCQKLERQYWRNCGLGKPAWYGADSQGSLYTDKVKFWNVAHLPSTLARLLPASQGLPGVNTPYLYFGMWRATFAWHVEDMDLFSINFIHFGAPKFWYSVPQGRAAALEQTMRGYFPKDTSQCPQFLRHKSFLASPTLLAQSSCRPNVLVQQSREFVITFPKGYHAGFNLGLNCAESVNFALDSWLELGKRAQVCKCISDSVRIDVTQLLLDREAEQSNPLTALKFQRHANSNPDTNGQQKGHRKRPPDGSEPLPKAKRIKTKNGPHSHEVSPRSIAKGPMSKITLKLGPQPAEPEAFPCCLCVSLVPNGLLRVHDPPIGRKDADDAAGRPTIWRAHEECANIVPETWVDEIEAEGVAEDGSKAKERVVFGVDGIVKDRWNLKCSACLKGRWKAHGAPIQCTKGKCPKAFHVSCARDGGDSGIVFCVLREVEKEVVLLDPNSVSTVPPNRESSEHNLIDTGETDSGPAQQANGSPLTNSMPEPRVLKVIRKTEVQVLCTQHNPAVTAAKKANKQAKIRDDLVALPAMTRIKIRVSAGVFEVSLIRVMEETKSVEVLWDRGIKREFKWGSVVFGNTNGQTVLQKPSEPAPEPEQHSITSSSHPVMTYPSLFVATQHSPIPAVTQLHPYNSASVLPYASHPHNYGAWAHQGKSQSSQHPPSQQSILYNGYYRDAAERQGYHYYPSHYRDELQWQRPYTGPRLNSSRQLNTTLSPQVPNGKPPDTNGGADSIISDTEQSSHIPPNLPDTQPSPHTPDDREGEQTPSQPGASFFSNTAAES